MLMTEHNLWFYQRIMQGLRGAIGEGRLGGHARGFLERYRAGARG
jgi:queuine tRNA-ribosyltransferase